LKDRNEALEKVAAELRSANQERDRFLSILAHDLKNPFSGFLSLVQETLNHWDRLDLNELRSVLLTMDQTAKNVYRLLETLLDWGLSRTGSLLLVPQPLPLGYLIEEAMEPLEESFRRKNIMISCELEFQMILADRYTVVTILRNLLSNAMKFTPSGGKVTVESRRLDTHIELRVTDTGIGISPARLDHLFRPEHKVTTLGTNREPGTGLGLMLCSEFARKNDGSLSVESRQGEGSTFLLRLPKAQESLADG
jgi:signal transduction histidine kinase